MKLQVRGNDDRSCLAFVACSLLVLLFTWRADAADEMVFPQSNWAQSEPNSQGIDTRRLQLAVDHLRANAPRDGVDELLIVRNGRLIFAGQNIDKVHGIWSCTKSFTSSVLGLLIDDGHCELDTPVSQYVSEMSRNYAKVTLRQFATMTSGYRADGDEPRGGYTHGPSRTPFAPHAHPLFSPGSKYAYWDSAMNQFANVLTRIAGEPMEALFKRRIAEPIGMNDERWDWGDFGEVNGSVVNGGAGNNGNHVQISARELARFGHLILNRGNWNGRQLLSAKWIDQATRVQVPATLPLGHAESGIPGPGAYGLNWWVNGRKPDGALKWPGVPANTFAAMGHNNNVLFVVPAWNMVIVRLGLDETGDGGFKIEDATFATFLREIGDAVLDDRDTASEPMLHYDVKTSPLYARIKQSIDAVRAIDTHDHLRAFDEIPDRVATPRGNGMTLFSVWSHSYLKRTTPLSPWPADGNFDTWWKQAHDDFDDARATSFYRYLLPAFRDLYGVDFDSITAYEAHELNRRIFENYRNGDWLRNVITERANIELMFIDPYWHRLQFAREYRFSVPVLNVTTIIGAVHKDRVQSDRDSLFAYAAKKGLSTETFEDFLKALDTIFTDAVAADVVCLKSTQAYQRTLDYAQVTTEAAAAVYGKPANETSKEEQKLFEDFMFWHICQLSAKYDLPFQVHTGDARIQGSNPMLLVDVIAANPPTKFILFHGGYPWVGETGAIAMKHRNVWIDSCWLPTLSYTMAKRAYQEWLEAVPSDRIMWGADTVDAEGIYAATEFTRQCLAEALTEKVMRGELREEHAVRIGSQVMRENALKLFPKLRRMLWRSPRRMNCNLGRARRSLGPRPEFLQAYTGRGPMLISIMEIRLLESFGIAADCKVLRAQLIH